MSREAKARMEADKDAFRGIDTLSFALNHGIIAAGKRPNRYWIAWQKGDGDADLAFKANGQWYSHRHGFGGGIVKLVAFWQAGGEPTSRDESRAIDWIAAQEGLYKSFAPYKARAAALVIKDKPEAKKPWRERILDDLEFGKGAEFRPNWAQAFALLKALGVDFRRWSAAMQSAGGEGNMALCWIPACPWLGDRVLRKPSGYPGDWTKDRIEAAWTPDNGAGRLVVVDLDGHTPVLEDGTKGKTVLPRITDVTRLCRQLADRGYAPRALVFSSWSDGDDRAKCHLYFVARAGAKDELEFKRWHGLLHDEIVDILSGWGQTEGMDRDMSASQITRLIRLPGFNKAGRAHAGVVGEVWEGAEVDFAGHWETRPVTVVKGNEAWRFGVKLTHTKTTTKGVGEDGEPQEVTKTTDIGRSVWPLGMTSDVVTSAVGIRYRYADQVGRVRHGVIPRADTVDQAAGKISAKEAAAKGVQILPGQGWEWVRALGEWSFAGEDLPTTQVVCTSGWHDTEEGGRAYVNGSRVYGADWIYDGPEPDRGHQRGTLEGWKASVKALVKTPALLLALGASFAGALIAPLGKDSFMIHFAGDSSSGKTRAARLGLTVWSRTRDELTYNNTQGKLASRMSAWSGAAVVIDEVKSMRPRDLGKFLHTLSQNVARGGLRRDATERDDRTWQLVAISTGENTISEYLGVDAQGGHTVRGMDIRIERGESTESMAHSDRLDLAMATNCGHAGDAWVEYLVAEGDTLLVEIVDELHTMIGRVRRKLGSKIDGAETGRILQQLALCCVALKFAARAGVVDLNPKALPVEELCAWAISRSAEERGSVISPEARAYAALCSLYESDPARFPVAAEWRTARTAAVVGISEESKSATLDIDPTGRVFVTETMLKNCDLLRKAGCSARGVLKWACAKGVCEGHGFDADRKRIKNRIAGQLRTWWILNLDGSALG